MRKAIRCLTALLMALPAGAGAQQPPVPTTGSPESTQSTAPDALDHWRRSTIALGQVRDDGGNKRFVTIASGVIVGIDEHHGCILTAKHAVYDPDKGFAPTEMNIRLPKDKPDAGPDLGLRVPLVVNGNNLWRSLPDADLAVVGLPDLTAYPNVHAVFLQDFGGAADIYQGASVIVLGYPSILGEDYLSTPLARGGIVSWTDPTGPLDKRFLIDSNMFNGNSGGPVFHPRGGFSREGNLVIGGGMTIIGIVVADAAERAPVVMGSQPIQGVDPATGKTYRAEALVLNIGGIGVVEPISKAKRLVEANCSPPKSQ